MKSDKFSLIFQHNATHPSSVTAPNRVTPMHVKDFTLPDLRLANCTSARMSFAHLYAIFFQISSHFFAQRDRAREARSSTMQPAHQSPHSFPFEFQSGQSMSTGLLQAAQTKTMQTNNVTRARILATTRATIGRNADSAKATFLKPGYISTNTYLVTVLVSNCNCY